MPDDDDPAPAYASPPCFMHEVDPVYMGVAPAVADQTNTEETRMTALSAEAMARLGEALLRDLPDAVVYSDADGIVQYWNGGAVRIFGFEPDEAIGQSLDIIIPARLRERHWQGYRHVMETGRSSHEPDELLSVPALTKSGETISVQFTVAAVQKDAGGIAGIIAVLRDVSANFAEIKRLRAALKEARS